MDILWHYLCSLTIKHTTSLKSVMLQSSSAAGGTAGVQPPVGLMEAVMEKIKQLSVRPLQAAARATEGGVLHFSSILTEDFLASGWETTIDRFKPHPMIMWKINISLLQEDTVRDEGLDWGQHSWTALNGRVSSWSSAGGSPLWASRLPPPETRSLSISRSDRGSHSETCGTQDGRAVNSILANNTDMIFSFYLIKTPQNVQ